MKLLTKFENGQMNIGDLVIEASRPKNTIIAKIINKITEKEQMVCGSTVAYQIEFEEKGIVRRQWLADFRLARA